MRNPPRIWRGGSKRNRPTLPHVPPKCLEVAVEVAGMSSSLQRFDIVADEQTKVDRIHLGVTPGQPE